MAKTGKRTTDHVHGVSAYAKGQRECDECRAAWAAYMKRRRQQQAAPVEEHYEGRTQGHRVRLSALADRLVRSAEARTGKAFDDIVEAALREAAPSLRF